MINGINEMESMQAFVLGFSCGIVFIIFFFYLLIRRDEIAKKNRPEKKARYFPKKGELTLTVIYPHKHIYLNAKVESIKVETQKWETQQASLKEEKQLEELFRENFDEYKTEDLD